MKLATLAAMLVVVLTLGGCGSQEQDPATYYDARQPDATVEFNAVQAAYIGSATGGNGTLNFRGRTYRFGIGGAGIGGIGASTIAASGRVYDLNELSRFPGTYAQVRWGFALGNRSSGELWLRNQNGVVLRVQAQRQGLMLSLGGDVMVITLNQ